MRTRHAIYGDRRSATHFSMITHGHPIRLATRLTIEHKAATQLPVRNLTARLEELRWTVPPHVISVLPENVVQPKPKSLRRPVLL
jgi:hypothetical protein